MIVNKYNYKKIKHQVAIREKSLSKSDQILVELKTNARSKSLPTIWAIWLAFGLVGGPRFYMGRRYAPLQLCLTIIGVFSALDILSYWMFGIGAIMVVSAFIWKIVDACHLNKWIRANRLETKKQLIDEYKK